MQQFCSSMRTSIRISLAFAMTALLLGGCGKDNPDVPQLADYTVIIYGMAGGAIDNYIEDIWEETQTWLPDGKIRVLALNKYGAESESFAGKYGAPGEVLSFELDKDTKVDSLHQEGADGKDFKLYDPANLMALLNRAKNELPAKEYVLVLYGHGGGFNAYTDYPKTKGVLSDELLNRETMNMYELSTAIGKSDVKHLKCILFNNCLMGGMESLMEVAPYADYFMATPFMLTSEENPLIPILVKNLREKADFETAARQTLVESEDRLFEGYTKEGVPFNGNVELVKSSELNAVCDAAGKLVTRLMELYPTQQMKIDAASCKVYQFYKHYPYFDLLDYAGKLSGETGDAQLTNIYNQMTEAFGRAILQEVNIDLGVLPTLPFYSMSVVLVDHKYYHSPAEGRNYDYQESYQLTSFHHLTGWGNWLDTNLCMPENNPCGQLELE